MAKVIERLGTSVDDAGYVRHDECPATYEQAEALHGERLDRRKSYAIIDGKVCQLIQWTDRCSGCWDDYFGTFHGCRECGYRGRCRRAIWVPLKPEDPDEWHRRRN